MEEKREMARPSKATRAQRQRRARARGAESVKAEMITSLQRSLCQRHFSLMDDDIFREEINEVCARISKADDDVKEDVLFFFPQDGMNQEMIREFKAWLKDEDGELIRSECLEWCRFVIRSFYHCAACRQDTPILIDSDSDMD